MAETDRAVSETLGFVFAFVLVVSTVALVTAVGFGGLHDARDAERVANAERAFDVLASNVDDVSAQGAPSRGTEIRLKDARLYAGDPVTMNVTVDGSTQRIDRNVTPVVYDAGTGAQLVYVNGAVIRQEGGASVMLRDPNLVLNETRATIPVVETYKGEATGVGGSTTVLVRMERTGTQLPVALREGNHDVTLRINNTARSDAWYDYLDSSSTAWDCEQYPSVDAVRCSGTVDRVYVSRTSIKVDFE